MRPIWVRRIERGRFPVGTVLDVTPISYAQCGLYAQFHRRERDVYDNLAYLYRRRHGRELPVQNVVGPPAEIVAVGAASTVTAVAAEVVLQPLALVVVTL